MPVGDRGEVDAILDEVAAGATSGTIDVDLVWSDADPATGVTPLFVCFPGERSGPKASRRTELTWPAASGWIQTHMPGAPGRQTLRTRLRFFDAPGQAPARDVELWELLVAQVAVTGRTYMVSDGAVWRAGASHIRDIDNLLAPRVLVNPPLPPGYSPGELEDVYNQRAAAQPGHVLLDKQSAHLAWADTFRAVRRAFGRRSLPTRKAEDRVGDDVARRHPTLASTQLLRTSADARDLLDAALRAVEPGPARLRDLRRHCASFESRRRGRSVSSSAARGEVSLPHPSSRCSPVFRCLDPSDAMPIQRRARRARAPTT